MVSAVDMAAPYIAVLSILKLVLLILVITELVKALGKGGDDDPGNDEPFSIRKREPQEYEEVEIEIINPINPTNKNAPAKIPRTNNHFVAKSVKVEIPNRCKHIWFITTSHNQLGDYDSLKPKNGVYYGFGRRNIFELKRVAIHNRIPDNEEVGLHVRLLTPDGKKVLGEAMRRIIIVPGPGTQPQPQPPTQPRKPMALSTVLRHLKSMFDSPSTFTNNILNNEREITKIFDYLHNNVIPEMDRIAGIINSRGAQNDEERRFLKLYGRARDKFRQSDDFSRSTFNTIKSKVIAVLDHYGVKNENRSSERLLSADPNWKAHAEKEIRELTRLMVYVTIPMNSLAKWWDKNYQNFPI